MSDDYDYLFKCICVGDGGCGKTAIVTRFSQGFFQEQYKLTIGVEFAIKSLEVKSHKVKLQIWDTGGQERFMYVRPLYYKGAMGAIIVFDLTNRESYDHIGKWLEEIRSNAGQVPMLLVGNKSDLTDQRQVCRDEAEKFAKDLDMFYLESSAKTGDGITDVFAVLALLMIGEDVPPEMLNGETLGGATVPKKSKPDGIKFMGAPNIPAMAKPVAKPVAKPIALKPASIPTPTPINAKQAASIPIKPTAIPSKPSPAAIASTPKVVTKPVALKAVFTPKPVNKEGLSPVPVSPIFVPKPSTVTNPIVEDG